MVCFVLRPGPPPTGLKPPTINYTSTSTTVATTPMDFVDNESLLSDGVVYDEMMMAAGPVTDLDQLLPATAEPAENATDDPYNGTGAGTPPLIYDGGGGDTVNLHGKSSSSDRGKHRNTWNPANHTFKPNYNKVGKTTKPIRVRDVSYNILNELPTVAGLKYKNILQMIIIILIITITIVISY